MTPKEMNWIPVYRDKTCSRCGRKYPKTILNIEGWIYHGEKLRCIDLKSCERAKKRSKK